ncbi:hypothetical protein Hanom_Chr11g00984311 [Helianthus anomalus]
MIQQLRVQKLAIDPKVPMRSCPMPLSITIDALIPTMWYRQPHPFHIFRAHNLTTVRSHHGQTSSQTHFFLIFYTQ